MEQIMQNPMENEKKITVTLDYYGNKEYGKRVFWISKSDREFWNYSFVWAQDFVEWCKEKQMEGYEVSITNKEECSKAFLDKLV
jgi:hypothetical protein